MERKVATISTAKQKGTRFESLLRDSANAFFRGRYGLRLYRPAQAGFRDVGDLHGASPFVIQAKNYKDLATALREGVDGAVKQAANAGEDYGVAVLKRARRPVGEAYAVMRWEDFCRVLLRLRAADDPSGVLDALATTAKAEPFPRAMTKAPDSL